MPGIYTYLIKLYLESLPIGQSERSEWSQGLLIGIIVLCLLSAFLRSNVFLKITMFGVLIRKTLTGILYRKLLKLKVSGIATVTQGKLITLASGDMALIEQGAWGLPYIVAAPLSTILQVAILFKIVREV